MRNPRIVVSAALLALLAAPASAQSSIEGWLNGFAMELGKTRANYTAVAQNVRCCEDSKKKVDDAFDSASASLARAMDGARRKSGTVCSRLDLLSMRVGFAGLWVGVLGLETEDGKNKGAALAQTSAQLKRMSQDLRGMDGSVKAYQARIGCPKRG
ncbi:hypothetical protein [Erythrobacter sp. YT30]|uniref:hypothetical protein n=1 Tax=Erythrobacter sp. YT30 TaxID=1735012 RepID=UPI00076D2E19|nr:hypothetical protein [Erythrobacter sp. YT30]KWV91257.1 hypothetical protein AUC45_08180 [Erythrobacter sp. YT30]